MLKPYWAEIGLVCMKCAHEWDDWQPHDCPANTWIAHVKTYRCPKCGANARKIGICLKPLKTD